MMCRIPPSLPSPPVLHTSQVPSCGQEGPTGEALFHCGAAAVGDIAWVLYAPYRCEDGEWTDGQAVCSKDVQHCVACCECCVCLAHASHSSWLLRC